MGDPFVFPFWEKSLKNGQKSQFLSQNFQKFSHFFQIFGASRRKSAISKVSGGIFILKNGHF